MSDVKVMCEHSFRMDGQILQCLAGYNHKLEEHWTYHNGKKFYWRIEK